MQVIKAGMQWSCDVLDIFASAWYQPPGVGTILCGIYDLMCHSGTTAAPKDIVQIAAVILHGFLAGWPMRGSCTQATE